MKPIDFAENYVRENLTMQQVLAVPGVMELVKNAHWSAILEAHDFYTSTLDLTGINDAHHMR